MRAHSQQPMSAIVSTNAAHSPRGAKKSMPTTRTRTTTAVSTRVRSMSLAVREPASAGLRRGLRGGQLLARAAEAALAAAEGGERFLERRGAEVRPERIGEVELRVRELPQEEIGDALLAARANEEIRLGRVGHREPRGEALLGDRRLRILLAAA